jgi:hypothetical protein
MSNPSRLNPTPHANRCVRFATPVDSDHATVAIKRAPPIYLDRSFIGWIALHTRSITSSARNRIDSGTVRPERIWRSCGSRPSRISPETEPGDRPLTRRTQEQPFLRGKTINARDCRHGGRLSIESVLGRALRPSRIIRCSPKFGSVKVFAHYQGGSLSPACHAT